MLISSRVKNAALLAAATLDDVDAIEFDWATWTLDDITTAMNRRLEGSSIEGVALVSHNTKVSGDVISCFCGAYDACNLPISSLYVLADFTLYEVLQHSGRDCVPSYLVLFS